MNRRTRNALDTATAGGISALGIAAIAAALVGIGLGVWAFTVWFSGTKGAGDLHKDQQSAQNREYWSAKFQDDMTTIQADQTNLATLRDAATSPGATQQDRTNYLGVQLNCRQDVAAYNADAGNVLATQRIPAGFPTSIDPTDYCGK